MRVLTRTASGAILFPFGGGVAEDDFRARVKSLPMKSLGDMVGGHYGPRFTSTYIHAIKIKQKSKCRTQKHTFIIALMSKRK